MKITLDALQAYLLDRYNGWVTEQALFIKLVEEMGEVAEVISMRAGGKEADTDDLQAQLGNELADMLHYVVAIAAINHIDLNQTVMEKDRRASVKYHNDVNLEAFLSRQEQ